MRVAVFVTGTVVAAQISCNVAIAGSICPNPAPNLQVGPGVEAHSIAFSDDGKSYTLNIYSAYAPEFQGAGSPWCIRYEIENTSKYNIAKLYLDAARLQIETLRSGDKQSFVITQSSKSAPTVTETVVYAFKSVSVRARVYQVVFPSGPPQSIQVADARLSHSSLARLLTQQDFGRTASVLDVANKKIAEQFLVKEPQTLPAVGAQLVGERTSAESVSTATFDGKNYSISLGFNVEGPIKQIQAPYFRMLEDTKYPDDLLRYVRQPEVFSRPISALKTTRDFSSELLPLRTLYLIDQPITIERPNGRACFIAPAYSPTPIPSSALTCNLFR